MAGTSYTRQSTFDDGDVVTAALFNNEYNKLLNAFVYASTGTTGHQHDGGAGEGGNIEIIGDQDFLNKLVVDTANNRFGFFVQVSSSAVEQIRIQDGAIVPVTDNDIDLGTSTLEFKDAYFDGTVTTDTLGVTTFNLGGTTVTSTAAELNIMDGVTSTASELNILDGVTSTAAELNILDGVTSTAAELNILDGVTSTATEINLLDGVTSTTAELNILDGVTSTFTELNLLDGVTSTTAELNILDGVTSTAAELNALDGITAVVGELNALDIGGTAVGTAVASKAVILDSNKDYTGIGNLTITGDLTIGGDDLIMGTNTAGMLLVADGNNFNPTAVSSLSEISTVANDDVFIAIDTSGGGLKKVTRSAVVSGLASSGAISNIVEDTSPQLGGNLDTNSQNILIDDAHFIADESGNEQLVFQTTGSAINQLEITNAAASSGPQLAATGGDTNIDLNIGAKGTGHVTVLGDTGSGSIQFNCEDNSHGQQLKAQPHSATVTNISLLPAGANSTLVSRVSIDTLTNKTLTSPKINEDVAVTSTATELNLLDGVTSTTAELNILDGVTSTAAELNILDGVTSTAAELNILDGVTSTFTELNLLDGVTSTTAELNILDGVTSTFTELNLLDGVTSTTAELNILDGVTSTAAELNILDGVTSTFTELNLLDGVTSTTAELNILDGVTSTAAELNILDGVTSTAAELNILDGVTSTAAELNQLDGVVAKTAGKETIWIPASAMQPTTSNPCGDLTTVETTSGRPDMVVLDFDKDADEFAQFSVAFPKSWNLGTVTFQVFWAGIAATTDCDWSVDAVAMNDNETIDVAFGTAVVVTDNAQGAVEELLVSAESGALTIAGTPADNDLCFFRIGRDVSGDAMDGDARLLGIKLFFTTDLANDG
jgi:hypothetical protein